MGMLFSLVLDLFLRIHHVSRLICPIEQAFLKLFSLSELIQSAALSWFQDGGF